MLNDAKTSTAKDEIVLKLFDLFRHSGYDAVSIADISQATGLAKSSLYHHFPGGKPDMAEAVADFAQGFVRASILSPLAGDAPLERKLAAMMKIVGNMYEGGGAPCLIAAMMISPTASPKAVETVRTIIAEWIDALAAALMQAGMNPGEARRRATAAIIAIQGALVVARATGDAKIFGDAMKSALGTLLAD